MGRLKVCATFESNFERFANWGVKTIDILGRAIGFENQRELAVLIANQAKVRVGTTNIARQNETVKFCIRIKPFDFHKNSSFKRTG